jgi:uncharacterized protein (DUF2147 family)
LTIVALASVGEKDAYAVDMRQKPKILVALSVLALAASAHASDLAAEVAGLWRTSGDEGLIRIEPCGAAICGRISDPAPGGNAPIPTDVRNADPALRDRPIDGLLIMKLKATGPGRWGDGSIYNPDDGRHYRVSMDLTRDGRLRVKGCLVVPLCRTQTWTRAGRVAERGLTAKSSPF